MKQTPARRTGLLAVVVLVVAAVSVVGAPRVLADHCPLYGDQNDQIAQTGHCRWGMLVDTGEGELMSRAELDANASYYESLGYPEDFAERAVEKQVTFRRGDGSTWTACDRTVEHANPCPEDLVRESPVMHSFAGDSVTLDVFVDPDNPDRFVARGCGNTGSLADTAKVGFELVDPPTRLEIGQPKEFRVTGTLLNKGPADTVTVEDTFTVEAPADCTVVPEQHVMTRRLDLGVPVDVDATFTIACGARSDHDLVFHNQVRLVGTKTVEQHPENNTRSITWRVGVFQPTDLFVEDTRIRCGERRFGPSTFRCEVTSLVGNEGPAPDVVADTTFSLAMPSDCTAVPAGDQVRTHVLAVAVPVTTSAAWDVTCLGAVRHVFTTTVRIAASPDDPHVEDVDSSNDGTRRAWVPIDVKPRSDPSSINDDKRGVIPVAILSTPELDATTEVVVDSLRFGATGLEDSLIGCGAPEDVNDDGLPDLVCRFDARQAGIRCGATEATVTGVLRDGTPFEGQDTVKVTGC